jgi:hypothetical protein
MDNRPDTLYKLIHYLKSYSWWNRLFHWNRITELLADTGAELQRLISGTDNLRAENAKLESTITRLSGDKENTQKELSAQKEKNDNYVKRGQELANELAAARQKTEMLELENRKLREEITQFKALEVARRTEHDKSIANLQRMYDRLTQERNEEKEKRMQQEVARLEGLKETWRKHEETVALRIKAICQKHAVDYMEKVPFKGKPDNTLKINDEFIIFDAKSPAGDDLSNFPLYLRAQAESVSKYVKEENVRREIFLVVPTNTLEILQQVEFRLSDYTVYVISLDSLEPIILALKKIEAYEFAEQLSPEERENISRVIGKFIHLSKRRIQIDGFFAKQFFEMVYRSEADLPKDFLEKVMEFERAEKLNPPIERRARQISNKELELEIRDRKTDAEQRGIEMDENLVTRNLNKLPLYTSRPAGGPPPDLFEKTD